MRNELANLNVATEPKRIQNVIPETINEYRNAFDVDTFWEFCIIGANTIIGRNMETVQEECNTALLMATDAVIAYDTVMRGLETPTSSYDVLNRLSRPHWMKDSLMDFYYRTQRAEMKLLWLNRKCKEMTGKYFFTERLPIVNGEFPIEVQFALCYLAYIAIDNG